MRRGDSSTYKFSIPYNLADLSKVEVIFTQENKNDLKIDVPISGSGILSSDKEICISLTANETFAFSSDRKAYVQLRGLTTEGVPFSSNIFTVIVEPTLFKTIITEEVGG